MPNVKSPPHPKTSQTTIIDNVHVVTPQTVLRNSTVTLKNGRITGVGTPSTKGVQNTVDGRGQYLLPGFIDLHCDDLEKAIQPRPGGQFSLDIAISEFDKRLTTCGITTMCHCICFMEEENNKIRSWNTGQKIAEQLHALSDKLLIDNLIHARLEITVDQAVPTLKSMINHGYIHLLSFMDHSPGQGQFKSHEHFKQYYSRARHLPEDKVSDLAEKRLAARAQLGDSHLRDLGTLCRQRNIPLASHDDDTPNKVEWMHDVGVTVSEFPVRLEAAKHAQKLGMHVLMGAPNALRGHSLTGNLSGRMTIENDCCDILASDFAPMTLLHAIFTLAQNNTKPLHELVRMVTSHPAEILGIDKDVGAIVEGKTADLVFVDVSGSIPRITKTYKNGRCIYSSGF